MISCSQKPKGLGKSSAPHPLQYNEYTEYINKVLTIPTPSGPVPSCYSPLVPANLPDELRDTEEAHHAQEVIEAIENDVMEAKDNLTQAKVAQAFHANQLRGKEDVFVVGDKLMLSTLHCCNEYKKKGEKRVAKFFPDSMAPTKLLMPTRRPQHTS